MTVTTTTARNDYAGTGSVGPFSYSFRIFAASDLLVTVRDADDDETTLEYPTDYTVTGVGNAGGGTIRLTTALASGEALTIRRVLALKQTTDFLSLNRFMPEEHQKALDRLTMIAQQQQDELDRTLKLPETVAGAPYDLALPVPSALTAIGWDGSGAALTNLPLDFLEALVDAYVDGVDFTAGVTDTLTLSGEPGSDANVLVTFDGVVQPHSGYSVSDQTLTFTAPIPGGTTRVEVQYRRGFDVSGRPPGVWMSVKDSPFKAKGTGAADDTTAIQAALTAASGLSGVWVYVPAGLYKLSAELTVPPNVNLLCERGVTFTTSLTGAALPTSFFRCQGGNTLENVAMSLGAAANGPGIADFPTKGFGVRLDSGATKVTLRNCDLRYFGYCVKAQGTYQDVTISGGTYLGTRCDLHFAGIGVYGSRLRIENTYHVGTRTWTSPFGNIGAIHVAGGFYYFEGSNTITDSILATQYVDGVQVVGTRIDATDGRPIAFTNCRNVLVDRLVLNQTVGSYTTAGVCDDAITFDLCQGVTVQGVQTDGGGENAIDLLSCQQVSVQGVSIRRCNTTGIAIGISDAYVGGLAPLITKASLASRGIVINGCSIEAYTPIGAALYQDVVIGPSNVYRQYAASTNFAGSSGNSPIVVLQGDASLASAEPRLLNRNLHVGGHLDLGGRAQIASIDTGTGEITFTAAHDFVTGEAVVWDWGGDVHQIVLPAQKVGTHNGSAGSANLVDTTTDFSTQPVLEGDRLVNATTGTAAIVQGLSSVTTVVAPLSGSGTWAVGDAYRILFSPVTPYYVVVTGPTTIKLAKAFVAAMAAVTMAIPHAGGGVGQVLYLMRSGHNRLFIDGTLAPPATVLESLSFGDDIWQEQSFRFLGMAAATHPNLAPGRRIVFDHLRDPYVDYYPGDQRGYKSHLSRWLTLPPFYSDGVDTFGVHLFEHSRFNTLFQPGDKLHPSGFMPADGLVRVRWS
jgi:hypothetical protein